jgi:hypothetical protein
LQDGKKSNNIFEFIAKNAIGFICFGLCNKKIILLSSATAKDKCFCHKIEITEK